LLAARGGIASTMQWCLGEVKRELPRDSPAPAWLISVPLLEGGHQARPYKEDEIMGQFEVGQSGNPVGRPKGACGGRIQALAALDRILGRKKNVTALEKALEVEFAKDPVRFFRGIIMPLLPKESKLELDRDGVIRWQSLLGGGGEKALPEG